MRVLTWKTIGRLLFAAAMGAPLLAPLSAQAGKRTSRLATATSQSTVCTKDECSAPAGGAKTDPADPKLGTAVTWMPSPDEAWRAAGKEKKLVFEIQVSGNFARQEFT
ncbi:MAG TPA: hypothetical protein VHC22_17790 [Pirellulales bacterium]|nr:hypothetical protein [Pirellulales bacterium]